MEEQNQVIKELSLPLYQAKGWMKLLAVVMIIYGILIALSIIGIIIAWLPIWLGVLLWQASTATETAQMTGRMGSLLEALTKVKMFFIINGVLLLAGLVLGIFSALIGVGSFLSMMGNY